MPAPALIDHSRFDTPPVPKLDTATNLVLIDNYDSFTWNVYQYLILEGATVFVYRNDQITLEELIAKKPTQLVVSPGPGHPDTDSGVSKDAISYFAGKIPIFGVCMGQQCIISAFGGKVDVTGEILHGKTSPLRHDDQGVYASIPQDVPVTRYHSLAGTHPTLPPCLEVSSWIAAGPDGGKGVIMGVRHKDYVMEGVQFHPESILTEHGRTMLKNFLKMTGGTWKVENKSKHINGTINGVEKKTNILEKIFMRRRELVAAQKEMPSQRLEDLQAAYELGLAPPQISFPDRLRQSEFPVSLLAEIKRASPSKGDIQLNACAPAQARKYAQAGASVISVLTEPDWFKGSLSDLEFVRRALDCMPNRPAILRKEFIFDEYQILEARLAGADTVLLIVKMLDVEALTRLYKFSQSLGMEPLVEVNTAEEMTIAVELGSQVIGVNNRDLTNFEVDLGTTSRLMDIVPPSTIVCALSGISGPKDVQAYKDEGVKGVLVGEALMRPADTMGFIAELLGEPTMPRTNIKQALAVKICGTRSPEAAKAAVEAGADYIGVIRVTGRSRFVQDNVVEQIAQAVRTTTKRNTTAKATAAHVGTEDYFDHRSRSLIRPDRAQLVGVYLNQPLETIIEEVHRFGFDMVQLHGSEPLEWTRSIPVPVIRRFAPGEVGFSARGHQAISLLDAGAGGSGKMLDGKAVRALFEKDPSVKAMLAGGLNADNVASVLDQLGPYQDNIIAVDTSSGVETDGKQDLKKITAFVLAAKGQRSTS